MNCQSCNTAVTATADDVPVHTNSFDAVVRRHAHDGAMAATSYIGPAATDYAGRPATGPSVSIHIHNYRNNYAAPAHTDHVSDCCGASHVHPQHPQTHQQTNDFLVENASKHGHHEHVILR
jgi:hypothetical protein